MNSLIVFLLAIVALAIGYGWYARSIDRNVIQPDNKKATPAKMYMDGVDFTPANRNVLFGYQFKSVAALGPIVGPIVAVRWGWLPALIWILLGTFFIGWVQDYSSIIISVREEGQTFGALSYRLISPRARGILLIFIYCYLLLIMGAFGKIV
ncbi:MAG: carbon starvation protein A, partial [Anaerolineae bacterium]|nr:carbon starvation protein A [Anaerolineae bacterium]